MSVQTVKGILQIGHPASQMTEIQLKSTFQPICDEENF